MVLSRLGSSPLRWIFFEIALIILKEIKSAIRAMTILTHLIDMRFYSSRMYEALCLDVVINLEGSGDDDEKAACDIGYCAVNGKT